MPFTVALHPEVIPIMITSKRLQSYKSVFTHSCEHQLVASYVWNSHVCSVLHPLLSSAEITVRNSIDKALVSQGGPGTFWWSATKLKYKSFAPGAPVPEVVQKVRDNFSRATNTARREKRDRYGNFAWPSHDDIIAKTDFSTWEWMFDAEFLGPRLIWQSRLGRVLKGPWPTTSVGSTLAQAGRLVKIVRDTRNRLSHHEPVWKRNGVTTQDQAVAHLNEKIDTIIELITLVSPHQVDLLSKNGIILNARRICSVDELERLKLIASPITV
ncbi:CAAX protease [Rhizobium sp. Root483D2]|uniref:CAAX protease n=1 Tax=Rhizobium sp. Root483D2 TaxID=1736545 RepID=UPI000B0A648C|nr:CAAX protease [Rhizobium sp. Root483D2]